MSITRERITGRSRNECSRCAPWLEDRDAADFGACYDRVPQAPTVRPKFHSLPHALKAMVWLVYIVFTVECVTWVCRALWRAVN